MATIHLKRQFFAFAPALLVCAGLALVAGAFSMVGWTIVDAHRAARRQEVEAQNNLSLGLERDVRRTIEVMDLSLHSAVHGMEMPGITAMAPATRQAVLFDGAIEAEGFGGAFITDEAGHLIYDSVGAIHPGMDVADRDYFQAQKAHPDLGLLVTPPLRHGNGSVDSFALVRRYNHPDGTFAGVVIGVLRLDYIQSLAEPLQLGGHGIVSLFNTDGILFAHKPFVRQDIGRSFSTSPVFSDMRRQSSGVVEAKSVLDGIDRLYTYRQVGQFPLVVTIGRAHRDVFAEWAEKTVALICILSLFIVVGAFLVISLRRELRRRGQAERAAKMSEQRHSDALARLDALFQYSDDSMLVARTDQDGQFVYEALNPVWERMTGVQRDMALGRNPRECLPPHLAATITASWERCLDERRPVTFGFETQRDGKAIAWDAKVVPVVGEQGNVTRLISVARDVTQRKAAEDKLAAMNLELASQATTDSLTGLANRRRLDQALDQEWRRAARDGSPLSMMMIDLDRFKLFNDQYGHQQGDACLRATAKVLSRFVRRPGDVAARYGGEELAILLPKTDATQAALLAERVRAAIEAASIDHDGNQPFGVVTASIGVTTLRPFASGAGGVANQLVATADAALYDAKRSGRNCVVAAADPMHGLPARKPHLTVVSTGV